MQESEIFENQVQFEVLSSTSEEAVFKSNILPLKENNNRGSDLPESTTTLHFFDPEDLARLKKIEKKLISEMEAQNNKKSLLEAFSDFFKI